MFGILPTRVHGYLDYLMGLALVVIPLAFDFGAGPQTWLPVLLGGGAIVYSLISWALSSLLLPKKDPR